MNRSLHSLTGTIVAGIVLACAAGTAAASDKAFDKKTAVTCADGAHAGDKMGCGKHGGVRATNAPAGGAAVQTQSAEVSATGQAPTTGLQSRTPAKPDPMAK